MLTIESIRTIVSEIGKKYVIKKAYLFGSYAKGKANNDSDVDIIIEKGELNTYKDYFYMCEELEKELGTNVDLLTSDSIRPNFFERIKNDRILLYGVWWYIINRNNN